jgi:16S rRNA (uracil1498-N3)-methyltransferase
MQWFYSKSIVENNRIILNSEESHHCVRVLRNQTGDLLVCTDGMGNYYECELIDPNPKHVALEVIKHIAEYGKKPYRLHIAIAPTKSNDRMEWFLEKATEIGVDEITPLLCEHSERKVIKQERMERIIESAMKQSQQTYLPVLNAMVGFNDFIQTVQAKAKYIAYCDEKPPLHLTKAISGKHEILVLIGPEGDFSDDEVQFALNHSYITVSLGANRLRTETAGVVSSAIVASVCGG